MRFITIRSTFLCASGFSSSNPVPCCRGEEVWDLRWHHLPVVYVCWDIDGWISIFHHFWRLWNEGRWKSPDSWFLWTVRDRSNRALRYGFEDSRSRSNQFVIYIYIYRYNNALWFLCRFVELKYTEMLLYHTVPMYCCTLRNAEIAGWFQSYLLRKMHELSSGRPSSRHIETSLANPGGAMHWCCQHTHGHSSTHQRRVARDFAQSQENHHSLSMASSRSEHNTHRRTGPSTFSICPRQWRSTM